MSGRMHRNSVTDPDYFIMQAIHRYRETERRQWNTENSSILKRVSDIAFPPTVSKLAYVHILDLEKSGVIKPHIDAVRVS